jgi:hypothetical protein
MSIGTPEGTRGIVRTLKFIDVDVVEVLLCAIVDAGNAASGESERELIRLEKLKGAKADYIASLVILDLHPKSKIE